MKKILFSLAAVAMVATACNKASAPTATLKLGSVPSSVKGNVVTIPVTVKGIRIVKPDGDTSGKTGHFHIFVDRRPLKPGKAIPKGVKGIVHTADNPIKIYGLTPGMHKFVVTLGNGAHVRIDPSARQTVKVKVDGPGVQGSAPATVAKGQDVVVTMKSEGVTIGDGDGQGHFHVIVDPKTPPKAGDMLSEASMTTGSSQTLKGLAPGEHVIFVVLAKPDHTAWDQPVMDRLQVTVTG